MEGDGWWIQVGKKITTTDVGPLETYPEESWVLIESDPLGALDLTPIRENRSWHLMPSPYRYGVSEENALEYYEWWMEHVKKTAQDCLAWIMMADGREVDYKWWPLLCEYDWRLTKVEAEARAAEMRAAIDNELEVSNVECPNCGTLWSEYLGKVHARIAGLEQATIGMPEGVAS